MHFKNLSGYLCSIACVRGCIAGLSKYLAKLVACPRNYLLCMCTVFNNAASCGTRRGKTLPAPQGVLYAIRYCGYYVGLRTMILSIDLRDISSIRQKLHCPIVVTLLEY